MAAFYTLLASLGIALSASVCNYFEQASWASGYAQPINECISDYTNKVSRLYTCSVDGNNVTATRYGNSSDCDATTNDIISEIYTSINASFECNGDDSCDICYRIYTDCDTRNEGTLSSSVCYIDNRCSHILQGAERKDGEAATLYSSSATCLSMTKWKVITFTGNSDCSADGDTNTLEQGCSTRPIDGELYYELYKMPCNNTTDGNQSYQWFNCIFVFIAYFIWF